MKRTILCVAGIVLALAASGAASGAIPTKERVAINATLDRFVVDAVARKDPAAAYDLVTPGMRAGVTRRDWLRGDLPVYPFPVYGTRFHGWRLDYAYPNDVALELVLQARNEKKHGAVAYSIEMKRISGRWLVDSIYPTALFLPGRVRASNDFTPQAAGSSAGEPRLGHAWIIAPFGLVAGAFLIPLGIFGARCYRDRRAMRRYAASR